MTQSTDILKIIKKGLSYIPANSIYATVVRQIIKFYQENPHNWELCWQYIYENHGYDKYPGNCHIIPNTAVMILALLYGEGDFSDTINICNRCGWDTDCNVGNITTIMGVRGGIGSIEQKWREPINDLLICSSVMGSLNIQDIPYGACYIAKLAAMITGQELPQPYRDIIENRIDGCHFEFEGSTHAMEMRMELPDAHNNQSAECTLINTDESAFTGSRSLKAVAKPILPGECVYVYKKTYYVPGDFHDSRYDPCFSPLLYPGQTVHGSAFLPAYGSDCQVCLYVREARSGTIYQSDPVKLEKGKWVELAYSVPPLDGALLDEAGFLFQMFGTQRQSMEFATMVDDLYFDGKPNYTLLSGKETTEWWTPIHKEISQFTRLKGHLYLDHGTVNLSCADFGEAYTGKHDFTDYTAIFQIEPVCGQEHYVNIRVQGGIRSYMAGFADSGRFVLLKNTRKGLVLLAETEYNWDYEKTYTISVSANGACLCAEIDGVSLSVEDKDHPYLQGAVGLSVRNGSHVKCTSIAIKPTKA